jgi:prophage tail gpP-like protein
LRRHIVLDTLADNDDQAAKRAQKLMLDGNLSAYTLTVDVAGWTCNTGHVWDTGWTVKYQSDVTRSAANGEWVIMARTLTLGRNGKQTQLKLKRKQYWMQPVAPLPPSDDEIQYPTEYDDDMAQ